MDTANRPPKTGRRFYCIVPRGDGLVDAVLLPHEPDGSGIAAIVVHGIDPTDADFGGDLEGHIRANFAAWCELGAEIKL